VQACNDTNRVDIFVFANEPGHAAGRAAGQPGQGRQRRRGAVDERAPVGAGVVGLACAHSLARAGREVVVIERETAFGTGISARNSEVIHAGLYYPPGSLKAALCVEGRQRCTPGARSTG
jgi:NADPH-dependent 2,4-dienoyl-CoA reductase/sulfur reductase-like enzyme